MWIKSDILVIVNIVQMGTSYGYLFYYLDFYIVDIAMFFPICLKVIAAWVACNPGNKMKPTLLGFWILKNGEVSFSSFNLQS
jgi:hypothetical protein